VHLLLFAGKFSFLQIPNLLQRQLTTCALENIKLLCFFNPCFTRYATSIWCEILKCKQEHMCSTVISWDILIFSMKIFQFKHALIFRSSGYLQNVISISDRRLLSYCSQFFRNWCLVSCSTCFQIDQLLPLKIKGESTDDFYVMKTSRCGRSV
jgi:hypothetical protein